MRPAAERIYEEAKQKVTKTVSRNGEEKGSLKAVKNSK